MKPKKKKSKVMAKPNGKRKAAKKSRRK